jgi:predicted dehydrogenase
MPFISRQDCPRVALIGVSGYGRIHYNLLRELHSLGEVRLTAVAIIDPEKESAVVAECRAAGCEVFADYAEMLRRHRGTLELCAIPTGIPWHTRMTLAALESGANVLVEKPLAATLAEVEAIRSAEALHARIVMLGFQYHYCAENLGLKGELLGSAIGTLRRIRCIGLWPRGADYYSRTDWAGRISSGQAWVLDSPISNAFAHHLSLALFFAGGRQERSAAPMRVAAELYRAQAIENFDTAALRIETDTMVDIRFYASHSCRIAQDPELVLEGDRGRVVWRHGLGYRIEAAGAAPRYVPMGDEQAARLCMFRTALRRLWDSGVFVCGTEIAREHTRCIQAAQCSGPVRDVPRDWIATNGKPGERHDTWVVGLEETMRRAFDATRTLGEAGCPWAGPPHEVLVADSDRDAVLSFPPEPATKTPIVP